MVNILHILCYIFVLAKSPWEIQRSVSTHQIFISGGGTTDQLKSKLPRSAKIFILDGVVQTNIPEILCGGTQGILDQKFWKPS